jgi:hypothetical protein
LLLSHLFIYLFFLYIYLEKTGKEREARAGAQHPPQGQDQLSRPSRTNRPNCIYLFCFGGEVVGLSKL